MLLVVILEELDLHAMVDLRNKCFLFVKNQYPWAPQDLTPHLRRELDALFFKKAI